MPSVYLERHGELRCTAQRGLWQILDGMSGSSGITGRTWKTGRPIVVPDVSRNPAYLEAIPGVVSEICVPITVGERTVGALNVESLTPLPSGMLAQLERCAGLLADRLQVIGDHLEESSWDRTVRASVILSGIADTPQMPDLVLRCLRDASRMDSGALILDGPDGPSVGAVAGPLGDALLGLSPSELFSLSSLVNDIRSCYTGGDALGRGFVGTDSLRDAGARVVMVLPLWAQRVRLGSVVLAHSRPAPADRRGGTTPRDPGRPRRLHAGLPAQDPPRRAHDGATRAAGLGTRWRTLPIPWERRGERAKSRRPPASPPPTPSGGSPQPG